MLVCPGLQVRTLFDTKERSPEGAQGALAPMKSCQLFFGENGEFGKMLKKKLYKWLVPKLLSKNCPSRIPRSGKKGQDVDCFSIFWDEKDRTPFLLVDNFSDNKFSGILWNGSRYEERKSISLEEAEKDYLFRAVHYFGLADIRFFSINDVALHQITRWVYLKIIFSRILEGASIYLFKRKKLITKKRTELLRFLVDNYLDSEQSEINAFTLMSNLYSIRWINHPEGEQEKRKLQLYLFALQSEGVLKQKNNGNYEIQGTALIYLEKYEEEEQRHQDSIRIGRKIFWLSVFVAFTGLIVAISGLITAKVIKVSPLWDLQAEDLETSEK